MLLRPLLYESAKIIGVLAKKKIGMTRSEIADATGITKSGQLSDALDTLSESGFVRSYRFYGKTKRNRTYQLIDNFTLFHFRFLDGTTTDVNFWTDTISSPQQSAWRGLAFERLCLQHSGQIRKALGISGVHTEIYAWQHKAQDSKKYCLYTPSVKQLILSLIIFPRLENLEEKVEVFRAVSKTRKAVHLTMVTSAGLVRNAYANQVQSEVTLDDLFAE